MPWYPFVLLKTEYRNDYEDEKIVYTYSRSLVNGSMFGGCNHQAF